MNTEIVPESSAVSIHAVLDTDEFLTCLAGSQSRQRALARVKFDGGYVNNPRHKLSIGRRLASNDPFMMPGIDEAMGAISGLNHPHIAGHMRRFWKLGRPYGLHRQAQSRSFRLGRP